MGVVRQSLRKDKASRDMAELGEMETSLQSLQTALEQIPEGRKAKGRIYPQSLLLCLMTLSKLCGYHAYAEMARFVRHHRYLMGMLGFTGSDLPCDDTFRYMVKHLDMEAYEASVMRWAQQELAVLADRNKTQTGFTGYAMDGKTLRGSKDKGTGQQAMHLLSLVQQGYRTTIAQEQTSKGQEIAAAKTLLSSTNLAGMVITADALLTQKGITSIIEQQQGRYLLVVKDNQKQAKELLAEVFREDLPPPSPEQLRPYQRGA